MNKIIKKGATITKVLIWNRIENDAGHEVTECKLTFDDGSSIKYECRDIEQLYNCNVGIYELLDDGTYLQIENWQ